MALDPRNNRKFNIIKQAKDYDPEGLYVNLWIPQLPHNLVFYPWTDQNSKYFPPCIDIPREWIKHMHSKPSYRKPFKIALTLDNKQ